MKNRCNEIAQADPHANFYVEPHTDAPQQIIEHLESLGFEVIEAFAEEYPEKPEEPTKEEYGLLDTDGNGEGNEEFQEAMEYYREELEEYGQSLEQIEAMLADGRAVSMYLVDGMEIVPHYRLVGKASVGGAAESGGMAGVGTSAGNNGATPAKPELTIAELEAKDKRNKEISIENAVEDVKRFIREQPTATTGFTDIEEQAIYWIMLAQLRRENFKQLGFDDERWYLTDKQTAEIAASLTEEQKTLIRRDFLLYHLTNTMGVNQKSEYLLAFSALHFPTETAAIRKTYDDTYAKRHASIEQRILLINAKAQKEQQTEAAKAEVDGASQPAAEAGIAASTGNDTAPEKIAGAKRPRPAAGPIHEPNDPFDPDEKPEVTIKVPNGTPGVTIEIEPQEEEHRIDVVQVDEAA